MVIYPAIDLYDGKAVRLFKGDYAQMTVYSEDPAAVARDFRACGADHIHLVDLAGAKSGKPENLPPSRPSSKPLAALWRWAAVSGIWIR